MPIGTSKTGIMGAGITPGGSETFNSTGTFCVPSGITKVNLSGYGGVGGAGGDGNPGGPGAGGNGGTPPCVSVGRTYSQPSRQGGLGFVG
ncbi:hypothetical protein N8205_01965, partial [Flavobacteriaceae bacterium]|nr:hypothetical protein [Flavobacteriaceae bacterium]